MIIYNSGKIKAYENLKSLSEMVGETLEFADSLWAYMLEDEELLNEFNYFVVNGTIKGEISCGELSLLDIYFSQMSKYNLIHDLGKNPSECVKERMVLHAFKDMMELRKNPNYMAEYLKRERNGMDIL